MKLKVTIAVDDVHPEKGWGLQGDQTMQWMDALNKKYGAKFTFFIPSNYHGGFPIEQHKDWINWLVSLGYLELAAHGNVHQTSDTSKWGECEFAEPIPNEHIIAKMIGIWHAWNQVGVQPLGWRSPGWLISQEAANLVGAKFNYAAVHYEHNRGITWPCKTIFGHDGINRQVIKIHDQDKIMFQSHIAGDWNDNVWNQANYEQLDASLGFLKENYDIEFVTMQEL